MKHSKYILFASLLLAGCKKEKSENVIPDDVPDMTDLQVAYTNTLVQEPLGWYVEYRPTSAPTTISLLVRFYENGTCNIISDYQGFTEEQENVRFRVGGLLQPELIFETYSVWHAVAENMGGKFEFYISPDNENSFSLTQVNGPVNTVYTLRRAQASDRANIQAKANVAQQLQDFAANASAYFKNLNLPSLAAFWELDTDKQTVRITWEDNNGERQSSTFSYNYIPNGILLGTPFMHEGKRIDTILFGNMSSEELEIVQAGDAGAGSITVSHTPAFPYKGTANLFMRIERELPRFFGYTLDDLDTYYSKDLQPHIVSLRDQISPDRFRLQLYHYNMNASGTTPESRLNSLQLLTWDATNTNTWLVFYTSLTKVDESHVIVQPTGEISTNGLPWATEVLAFMDLIFPPEGVTIVPNGRSGTLQVLRVISRKNSRIYFDIIVSTPTGIYVD